MPRRTRSRSLWAFLVKTACSSPEMDWDVSVCLGSSDVDCDKLEALVKADTDGLRMDVGFTIFFS